MKYKRFLRKIPVDLTLISIILLGFLLAAIVFFVPPTHFVIVFAMIVISTYIVYLGASYFVIKKFQYIAALSIFLFLLINYLVGFDLINTILLLSFIIGMTVIVK